MSATPHYDVLIVGAGIAGSTLAYALSTAVSPARSTPLRIALLERSLAEPDRIVGELLQPGGVMALTALGMESCLENIDAVPVRGYCVVHKGAQVHIPYPHGYEGRSFHHGRFIMTLRQKAMQGPGVDIIEATVTDLIECPLTRRVVGVQATRKGKETKEPFLSDLVVIADGCFSNFRTGVLGTAGVKPATRSYFIGAILEDLHLPIEKHGTVALVPGSGPVLLYQIAKHDTRILIDIKAPVPDDLKSHILSKIVPELPASMHLPIQNALEKDRLRRMPNSFLPAAEQGGHQTKEGVILLGDAWNMRHPLTGGGMTVAFNDVVKLTNLLKTVKNLGDWDEVSRALHLWHWSRKPLASTINMLSVALYDLFGAEDDHLDVLRVGCFKYFERGGQCVEGPVSLLSGIAPSPVLLFFHFFAVAFYSIWVMFTHARPVPTSSPGVTKLRHAAPRIDEYPALAVKSVGVLSLTAVNHPLGLKAPLISQNSETTRLETKLLTLDPIRGGARDNYKPATTMSDTHIPGQQDQYHPQYASPHADIVLRSSEGTLFRVHSTVLKLSSDVFEGMFDLPPEVPTSPEDMRCPIDIAERTDVLLCLLEITNPASSFPVLPSLTFIGELLVAAEKYNMIKVISTVRAVVEGHAIHAYNSACDVLELYAVACRYDWQELAKAMSTRTLGYDLGSAEYIAALEKIPTRGLLRLQGLHLHRRRGMLDALMQSDVSVSTHTTVRLRWHNVVKSKKSPFGGVSCTHSESLNKIVKLPSWINMLFYVAQVLEKEALGSRLRLREFIDSDGLSPLWKEKCVQGSCSGCGDLIFDKERFHLELIHILDELPRTI